MKNIKIKLLLVFIAINFSVLKPKRFDIPYLEEQIENGDNYIANIDSRLDEINSEIISYNAALDSSRDSFFDEIRLKSKIESLEKEEKEQWLLKDLAESMLDILKNYLNYCKKNLRKEKKPLRISPKVLTICSVKLLLEILSDSPEVDSLFINSAYIYENVLKLLFINIYNKKTSVKEISFWKSKETIVWKAFHSSGIKYDGMICSIFCKD